MTASPNGHRELKILLVSEGPHELGHDAQIGALEILVCRIRDIEIKCDTEFAKSNAIHTHRGKGKGFYKRAIRWLLEAQKRGYDALVFLIDEDGDKRRVSEIEAAQVYDRITFPRALGVAIRMFDAWMLADEKALTTVLGHSVDRQRQPESNRNPKVTCQELLDRSEIEMPLSEVYSAVAEQVDLDSLVHRCDRSFHPFRERVNSIAKVI